MTYSTDAPLVYFARGVDGLSRPEVLAAGRRLAQVLLAHGVTVIDPVLELQCRQIDDREVVEHDLRFLRRSDAVFMDMSIPRRNYVGCCCELVYAHLWRIPAVVYVGRSGNQGRPWLCYHAAGVHTSYRKALTHLLAVLPTHSIAT